MLNVNVYMAFSIKIFVRGGWVYKIQKFLMFQGVCQPGNRQKWQDKSEYYLFVLMRCSSQ